MKMTRTEAMPRRGSPASPASRAIGDLADALSDPLRLRILQELALRPQNVDELAVCLNAEKSAIAYHLANVLEKRHLLVLNEDGRYAIGMAKVLQSEAQARELADTLKTLRSEPHVPPRPEAHYLLSLNELVAGAERPGPENGNVLLGGHVLHPCCDAAPRISIFMAYFCEFDPDIVSRYVPVCLTVSLPEELEDTIPGGWMREDRPLLFAGEIREGAIYVRSLGSPPQLFEPVPAVSGATMS